MRSGQLFCSTRGVDGDGRDVRLDVVCGGGMRQTSAASATVGLRTEHAALLLHERAEVAEDLVQFMYACLNLPDLLLTLLDE